MNESEQLQIERLRLQLERERDRERKRQAQDRADTVALWTSCVASIIAALMPLVFFLLLT